MNEIVKCNNCNNYEFYGEMRWLTGKELCRTCYKQQYKNTFGKLYKWDDLDGYVPTEEDYLKQKENLK